MPGERKPIVWNVIGVVLFVLTVATVSNLVLNPDPAAVARAAIVIIGLLSHFVSASWLWATPEQPRRYPRFRPQLVSLPVYLDELPDEHRAVIDASILDCNIRGALGLIQASCGVSFKEALDMHWKRYQQLRAARPAEFGCTDEQWRSQLTATLRDLEREIGDAELE